MDGLTQEKIQSLSDLDLAILVSLISSQHCIVSTERAARSDLRDELRLTCNETFGLQTAVVDCAKGTTADDFNEALLVDVVDQFDDAPEDRRQSPQPGVHVGFSSLRHNTYCRPGSIGNELDERRIADVVIATHLDLADANVQVQALELLRTRRIFTRTSMHVAPNDFLLVVILSEPRARLSHHLNDMFAMSHDHADDDGLPHLEEGTMEKSIMPIFSPGEIKTLRNLVDNVKLSGEVRQYLHNVVVFTRMSRYVKGGVTAASSRHLRAMAMALAPLHGLDFVTPSLVALGARKVYPHRLVLATAETEKSLQWGSDPEAVRELLE
ncbi:hypothetical protein EJ03DRAFT_250450, partial [Teratosphaeria nubilosa]